MPAPASGIIPQPCVDCGATSYGTRCDQHTAIWEAARLDRQPYRAAYSSHVYRRNRSQRLELAGGRCEGVVGGDRCGRVASEVHHVTPLSTASTYQAALALCAVGNLRAVCFDHNPRGTAPRASDRP